MKTKIRNLLVNIIQNVIGKLIESGIIYSYEQNIISLRSIIDASDLERIKQDSEIRSLKKEVDRLNRELVNSRFGSK